MSAREIKYCGRRYLRVGWEAEPQEVKLNIERAIAALPSELKEDTEQLPKLFEALDRYPGLAEVTKEGMSQLAATADEVQKGLDGLAKGLREISDGLSDTSGLLSDKLLPAHNKQPYSSLASAAALAQAGSVIQAGKTLPRINELASELTEKLSRLQEGLKSLAESRDDILRQAIQSLGAKAEEKEKPAEDDTIDTSTGQEVEYVYED